MKILNDCSNYHMGSYLVMHQIRSYLKNLNLTNNQKEQLLIINGEGTFHHDAPRALDIIKYLKSNEIQSKKIFLNSVWQNMTETIPNLSLAYLRESFSEKEFKLMHPNTPTQVVADITLTYEYINKYSRTNEILVFDSVSSKISEILKNISLKINGKFIEMCNLKFSYKELLDLIASSKAVITGRYHGAMFAAITNTPFLCCPSNTWKTKGFMHDINQLNFFSENADDIIKLVELNEFATVSSEYIMDIKNKWQLIFENIKTL